MNLDPASAMIAAAPPPRMLRQERRLPARHPDRRPPAMPIRLVDLLRAFDTARGRTARLAALSPRTRSIGRRRRAPSPAPTSSDTSPRPSDSRSSRSPSAARRAIPGHDQSLAYGKEGVLAYLDTLHEQSMALLQTLDDDGARTPHHHARRRADPDLALAAADGRTRGAPPRPALPDAAAARRGDAAAVRDDRATAATSAVRRLGTGRDRPRSRLVSGALVDELVRPIVRLRSPSGDSPQAPLLDSLRGVLSSSRCRWRRGCRSQCRTCRESPTSRCRDCLPGCHQAAPRAPAAAARRRQRLLARGPWPTAADMACRNYFDHRNRRARRPLQRPRPPARTPIDRPSLAVSRHRRCPGPASGQRPVTGAGASSNDQRQQRRRELAHGVELESRSGAGIGLVRIRPRPSRNSRQLLAGRSPRRQPTVVFVIAGRRTVGADLASDAAAVQPPAR